MCDAFMFWNVDCTRSNFKTISYIFKEIVNHILEGGNLQFGFFLYQYYFFSFLLQQL